MPYGISTASKTSPACHWHMMTQKKTVLVHKTISWYALLRTLFNKAVDHYNHIKSVTYEWTGVEHRCNDNDRENPKYMDRTILQWHSHRNGQGLKLGLCSLRPATNCLSILKHNQQDATLYNTLYYCQRSMLRAGFPLIIRSSNLYMREWVGTHPR